MVKNNYIAGEWLGNANTVENHNPSQPEDLIGLYAQADEAQLQTALAAAKVAQIQWANVGLEKRQSVLAAIGSEMIQRSAELGEQLSREEGKPLAEGVGEVYRAGQFFQYFAAETLRQLGSNADSVRPGVDIDVRREPIGTVAVISPWNFPTATASWKIAPALAFGNAVLWKPANLTPASAVLLTEIIAKQDIPAGLFNLVMGGGDTLGCQLVSSPLVDGITFTGSLAVGRKIAAMAMTNLTKLQMEMGSKNPLVVMDDADLDIAVRCAVIGAYGGSGQKCTASSRLIVHDEVFDVFVEKMSEATKALKVGDALDKNTQMGPVVSAGQLESNMAYMSLAKEEGAQHICGGERLPGEGYFMSPALLVGTNDMRINREEMFAPIACVLRAKNYEEALQLANDTEYGLASGIITQSLARAQDFRRRAKTGCVMVNLPTAGTDYHVPFGGRKNSSYGSREQGPAAAEFYTVVKTAYINAGKA